MAFRNFRQHLDDFLLVLLAVPALALISSYPISSYYESRLIGSPDTEEPYLVTAEHAQQLQQIAEACAVRDYLPPSENFHELARCSQVGVLHGSVRGYQLISLIALFAAALPFGIILAGKQALRVRPDAASGAITWSIRSVVLAAWTCIALQLVLLVYLLCIIQEAYTLPPAGYLIGVIGLYFIPRYFKMVTTLGRELTQDWLVEKEIVRRPYVYIAVILGIALGAVWMWSFIDRYQERQASRAVAALESIHSPEVTLEPTLPALSPDEALRSISGMVTQLQASMVRIRGGTTAVPADGKGWAHGRFSPDGLEIPVSEVPLRRIPIPSFLLSRDLLRLKYWRIYHALVPSSPPGCGQQLDGPVQCVSWSDARLFVRWLDMIGRINFRFASAVEWDYALRAGSPIFPWGGERRWDGSQRTVQQNAWAFSTVLAMAMAYGANGWAIAKVTFARCGLLA